MHQALQSSLELLMSLLTFNCVEVRYLALELVAFSRKLS